MSITLPDIFKESMEGEAGVSPYGVLFMIKNKYNVVILILGIIIFCSCVMTGIDKEQLIIMRAGI